MAQIGFDLDTGISAILYPENVEVVQVLRLSKEGLLTEPIRRGPCWVMSRLKTRETASTSMGSPTIRRRLANKFHEDEGEICDHTDIPGVPVP